MTERLTEKITNKETGEVLLYRLKGQWGEIGDNRMRATKKLGELEDAEEDGRLVVLPCKVGDTLFVLTPDSPTGIETTKCIRLSIDKRGIKIQAPAVYDDWGNAKWNFKPTDFGKKVFLDFEEAKSFKEMEEEQ